KPELSLTISSLFQSLMFPHSGVVLHLPEIEKWLRAAADRVTQLSHSVSQDREMRHVDAHLLQLKDVCEDISDHVEQIHALLETEFSLKLLSYSVNIIVDIRSVQLLWHQLRVSVLVLKERLLQGLQDSNGNFTRQTDILQTRLEDLTEEDDCGALTIRCSQNYFSLDCGITAFELSDYSPSEEAQGEHPSQHEHSELEQENRDKSEDLETGSETTTQCNSECSKRHLTRGGHSAEASPTHPSRPKRAALLTDPEGTSRDEGEAAGADPNTRLQTRAELSDSAPSLMEPPDRNGFWLELDKVYPHDEVSEKKGLPLNILVLLLSKNNDITRILLLDNPHRPHWFGSEEFLALPAQLRKTELLAMNLESLAKTVPLVSVGNRAVLASQLYLFIVDLIKYLALKRQLLPRRCSPSSSSDAALSLDESLESGRISELHSEDEAGIVDRGVTAPPMDRAGRDALMQKLLQHLQRQEQEPHVWTRMESLVQKLDGFISWLQDSLDATENWTQPRQDLESLRVYLATHLSFKLNVDSHSSLKDGIMEEGRVLLNSISSHHSALRDILHMVSAQWEQLQKQIRRQHGWMLRALRCVQSRLFYQFHQSHEALSFEAQRAALEQMAVRLNSLQYTSPASRRSTAQTKTNSLQELEAEFQELSDWLMDMDAMVTDSHQLMMSEEQRHHLFKVRHAPHTWTQHLALTTLLSRLDSFRRSGNDLPRELILSVHSSSVRSAGCPSLLSAAPAGVSGRSTLSPLTASLLDQLESRIKELKSWLRDTELLIFNSCLRNTMEPTQQLDSFKSLCSDIRARRRGVSSVLKLCQKLLGPTAELSPEAQQHQEALQLLSINLERRWEAIVMQALQWQNRLKRELGDEQVPGNFLEPGLVDLHQVTSLQNGGTSGILADDSWEWDETDMTISESKEETQEPDPTLDLNARNGDSIKVYQVYSIHQVELYAQPQFPRAKSIDKHKPLTKSLSKDSQFSSVESLPDILGGLQKRNQERRDGKVRKGFERGVSVSSRRSESESGIDTGDAETASSGTQDFDGFEGKLEKAEDRKGFEGTREFLDGKSVEERRKGRFLMEDSKQDKKSYTQRRKPRKCAGEAVEIMINGRGILTPPDSDSDAEFENATSFHELSFEQQSALENQFSPVLSQGSSLESLLAMGVELFPIQRSASLEGANRSVEEEEEEEDEETAGSEGLISVKEVSAGELSTRTLDLLKRLENIQSPLGGKMTRSVSDMALVSASPNRIPASPSLGGKVSPLSGISSHLSPPPLIHESSASLNELSSTDDLSAASDDFKSKQAFLDPAGAANANFYCKKHGNRLDEPDVASLSMVVNVSSACTDDEDDNSDLLSSSTLTEEELGVRDETEERFSATSSANEDDFDGPFGLDYMQKELQNWIRTPFSKSEIGLKDELQCGSNIGSNRNAEKAGLNSSKLNETKRGKRAEEENRRNATRSYISQFVDDVENGNIDQSCFKSKDADAELLREEASVFTKKGETLRDSYVYAKGIAQDTSRRALLQPPPRGFYSDEAGGGGGGEEDVHSFVMEIIDLTNARMNGEEAQSREEAANIRDKVLEHSHRPVQLRQGDFYSYLSLSSHDSDCGEVLQLSDDNNIPSPPPERDTGAPHPMHPLSPDIRDEETLFSACTEEVYLGPPLCYSLAAPKRQRKLFHREDPRGVPEALRFESGNMREQRDSYYSVLEARDGEDGDDGELELELELVRGERF
uniref:A kinase (PRKA) anchor protein 6 n=1 Tax=Neogobius melanostomus TaxID=47308 RepID=A0A8C6SMM4_9GOBI